MIYGPCWCQHVGLLSRSQNCRIFSTSVVSNRISLDGVAGMGGGLEPITFTEFLQNHAMCPMPRKMRVLTCLWGTGHSKKHVCRWHKIIGEPFH